MVALFLMLDISYFARNVKALSCLQLSITVPQDETRFPNFGRCTVGQSSLHMLSSVPSTAVPHHGIHANGWTRTLHRFWLLAYLPRDCPAVFVVPFTWSPLSEAVSDLSKFQSLCEEVIDLDHLRESGGRQVRVRPSFHEELKRLEQELDRARSDMLGVLRDVEKGSKVRGTRIGIARLCCTI